MTLPSVEDSKLWADFDALRNKMLAASQTSKVASRYGITKKELAAARSKLSNVLSATR